MITSIEQYKKRREDKRHEEKEKLLATLAHEVYENLVKNVLYENLDYVIGFMLEQTEQAAHIGREPGLAKRKAERHSGLYNERTTWAKVIRAKAEQTKSPASVAAPTGQGHE